MIRSTMGYGKMYLVFVLHDLEIIIKNNSTNEVRMSMLKCQQRSCLKGLLFPVRNAKKRGHKKVIWSSN